MSEQCPLFLLKKDKKKLIKVIDNAPNRWYYINVEGGNNVRQKKKNSDKVKSNSKLEIITLITAIVNLIIAFIEMFVKLK